VTGQIDERRAHCTIFVTVVVRTGISISDMCHARSSWPQSKTPLRHT
jgi:hypothetical protein